MTSNSIFSVQKVLYRSKVQKVLQLEVPLGVFELSAQSQINLV